MKDIKFEIDPLTLDDTNHFKTDSNLLMLILQNIL